MEVCRQKQTELLVYPSLEVFFNENVLIHKTSYDQFGACIISQ